MKWLVGMITAMAVCCFALSVEARDFTRTRTRSVGSVQSVTQLPPQAQSTPYAPTALIPQANVDVTTTNAPTAIPIPASGDLAVQGRCRCGCGQEGCNCGRAPSATSKTMYATTNFGPPNDQNNPNYRPQFNPNILRPTYTVEGYNGKKITRYYDGTVPRSIAHTTDVVGMTVRDHLIRHHGYTAQQLRNKSYEELRYLHDQMHR